MSKTSGDRKRTKAKSRATISIDDVAQLRKKLDEERLEQRSEMMWAHFWRVCPKCGGDMFEQLSMDIRFEVCRRCHGIYLDQAEVALTIDHKDAAPLLKAILAKSKKPQTEDI